MEKLLIRTLLGSKKSYFKILNIGKTAYSVSILPYEPADKFVGRMKQALQEQGLKDI